MEVHIFLKLLAAAFFSSLLGAERFKAGRPDGFKTYILVGLGSCLFVVTSTAFYQHYGNFSGVGPVGVDPGRVAAQVVTGVGFLGAGAIMRDGGTVRGLTSAACLWVVAAIGIACGIGMYCVAGFVTALTVGTLVVLEKLTKNVRKHVYRSLSIRRSSWEFDDIEAIFTEHDVKVIAKSVELSNKSKMATYEYRLRYHNTNNMLTDLLRTVSHLPDIETVKMY